MTQLYIRATMVHFGARHVAGSVAATAAVNAIGFNFGGDELKVMSSFPPQPQPRKLSNGATRAVTDNRPHK